MLTSVGDQMGGSEHRLVPADVVRTLGLFSTHQNADLRRSARKIAEG